jgi:hypothetical protein
VKVKGTIRYNSAEDRDNQVEINEAFAEAIIEIQDRLNETFWDRWKRKIYWLFNVNGSRWEKL